MKILVVEPYFEHQEWLVKSLTDAGHEVAASCDAYWSLLYWRCHRPFDVIVMNNLLGGMKLWRGEDFIEAIRQVDPNQPFIVQTYSENVALPPGVPLLRRPYGIRRLLRLMASARQQRLPLFDRPETG